MLTTPLGATVIFVLLFLASSGYHTWQIYRLKSWYFIPFLVGCLRKILLPALSYQYFRSYS